MTCQMRQSRVLPDLPKLQVVRSVVPAIGAGLIGDQAYSSTLCFCALTQGTLRDVDKAKVLSLLNTAAEKGYQPY